MNELDRLVWAVESSYALGEARFGVRTTSKRFGEWLDHALGAYRVTETTPVHYSIVIADGDSAGGLAKERYHTLYKATVANSKTLDIMTLVRTFLSDLEQYLWLERDDAIYADMAPVSLGGATALVPWAIVPYIGTLGRRRTDRHGLGFPAETSVEVDLNGRVVPFRPLVRLADGSLDALAEAFPGNGRDNRTVVKEPVDVDLVLSIGAVADPLAPISRGLGLYRLASHVGNIETLGAKAVEGLRPIVERARCFEFGSGKPAVKLEALLTALRSV
jgi:hypothetical protein